MLSEQEEVELILSQRSRFPARARWLRRVDALCQIIGVSAVAIGHGLESERIWDMAWDVFPVLAMFTIAVSIVFRYRWSVLKPSFASRHRAVVWFSILWGASATLVIIFVPLMREGGGTFAGRWNGLVAVSEGWICLYSVTGVVRGIRNAAARGVNPALLLVGSFAVLIGVGTALLMLPRCRAHDDMSDMAGAPFLTALFTSTSASCVTGLVVEDTGTYWSRTGQVVIMCLFQVGGLGIMTFGAFFGVVAGRNIPLRESATLHDLLASEGLEDVRRLAMAILCFTVVSELTGAVLLLGLWPDLPWGEQMFQSLFHSVSAFCNAGFALTPNSFVGMGHRWQVWGVLAGLIIIGGLGFSVLNDVAAHSLASLRNWKRNVFIRDPRERTHLSLTSRLVLITTAALLAVGLVGLLMLERVDYLREDGMAIPVADAWFQSVAFRTAGFNTVEMGELSAPSKLLGIGLMFIGASPGSTGGGVKTIVFAVTILGLLSILRGRENIECMGRMIPIMQANRALAIMFLGVATLTTVTLLIVLFEHRPEWFLDHLFEAASAVGTVGVSSSVTLDTGEMVSVTKSLSSPSRVVIIMAMFLGRVGPLTLLLGLISAGQSGRYEYPAERVTLG